MLAIPAALSAAGDIDFNRDIRPILSNNCFHCHGPDAKERKGGNKKQGGLRLDTNEGMLTEFDGIAAVVPGKPDESELILRITTDDKTDLMPPRKTGKKLAAREIELLTNWIKQGAPFARHWSYVKPKRPALPSVSNKSWPKNAIDYFVLSRLDREGLKPSPAADRYAIIRRLSLDLTGLPPTVEETDAFVNDKSANAYEKLVDRLLAKKTYGEHWARMWLDLARYADSAGYADDPPRTIWGYRDYVIQSINDNKPFDQFTIEQIAGDLIPGATSEQLVATAFHRNTQTNNEGGTNDEEYRNVAIIDRVNTTLAVWMGTTMTCGQCHSHKYDPVSQEEYFQVFAIFNNTEDADKRNEAPTTMVLTEAAKQQRADIQKQIDDLHKQIAAEAKKAKPTTRTPESKGPIPIRFIRIQMIGNGVYLHLAEVEAFENGVNIATKGKASQISTGYNGPAKLAIDGNRDGDYEKKSVSHTAQANNPWIEVDLGNERKIEKIMIWNRTDGGTASRLKQFRFIAMDGKRNPVWVRRFNKTPNPSVFASLPGNFEEIIAGDRAELATYVKSNNGKPASPLQKKLNQLQKQLAGIKGVTVPIMRELQGNRRRKTHIQIRGNYLVKDKQVAEGLPERLFTAPSTSVGGAMDRMTLAKWLIHNDNPLTPRVIVNRYWEQMFGIGIVSTPEEFGSQGDPPTHPQLLDWLAAELIRLKWNTRAIVKLIVMSATYRQASRVTPAQLERDPENRLFARGPRFRLSAEMIRDQALFVSGLLSSKMYGPPVKPPQPQLGVKAAFGSGIDWKTSGGEDKYRRGLYTTWRRSNPYPSMSTFDAPSREVCTIRRDRTNTPLQALVTLNDPVYVEAAQSLARRIAAAEGSTSDKVRFGFRVCLSRQPNAKELARLTKLYQNAYDRLAKDPAKANTLATKPLGPAPAGSNVTELAAWTLVGNVMLNLDEMFMKR